MSQCQCQLETESAGTHLHPLNSLSWLALGKAGAGSSLFLLWVCIFFSPWSLDNLEVWFLLPTCCFYGSYAWDRKNWLWLLDPRGSLCSWEKTDTLCFEVVLESAELHWELLQIISLSLTIFEVPAQKCRQVWRRGSCVKCEASGRYRTFAFLPGDMPFLWHGVF